MITLRNLSAGYGKKAVLKDISAAFTPGKITGIIGPNGSGKSTLLKTILGFIPPSQGQILIDGRDLHSFSAKERARRMAFCPSSGLFPK